MLLQGVGDGEKRLLWRHLPQVGQLQPQVCQRVDGALVAFGQLLVHLEERRADVVDRRAGLFGRVSEPLHRLGRDAELFGQVLNLARRCRTRAFTNPMSASAENAMPTRTAILSKPPPMSLGRSRSCRFPY